jgi:homocysteine S-methyltransferase
MKKYIAVEIDPPADADIRFFMDSAIKMRSLGVDAITIADNPFARSRADSAIIACKLARETGMKVIPHLTCRDRNLNALKSALLGLSIEGIDAVLAVTGDPVQAEDRSRIKSLAGFCSLDFARTISEWNATDFTRPFTICGALNVNAPNFQVELNRAILKTEAGVSVFFTQPVLGEEAVRNLERARGALPLETQLLGGILPVVSHRNALFMNQNLNGITVSEEIAELYREATKERATELAVSISVDIMEKISPSVDGYYLITPFKRIDIIESIVAELKSPHFLTFSAASSIL